MLIDSLNLPDGAWVLEFSDGVLFNTKHDAVFANDCNGCTTSIYSFKGILDLEQLAIWGEDSDSFVVGRHDLLLL